jgi:DNA polymerase III alpha subunit
MAFLSVDDLYGSYEVIVFESIFNRFANCIEEEKIVLIEGRLSIKEDEPTKIIASSIKEMLNEDETYARVNVNITDFSEEKKEELRKAIRYYSKLENATTQIDITINGEVRKCGQIHMDNQVALNFYKAFGKENIYISH